MKKDYPKQVPIAGRVRICLELIKSIDLTNKTIVDVGCSFGWLEKEIVKLKPKNIIGIDPEKDALNFARGDVLQAEFMVGSATDIPLPAETADAVILYDVIEHVPKNKELVVLKEIYRVLKKGGTLLLSTPNKNLFSNIFDAAWYFGHRHYSEKTLRSYLSTSGFNINKLIIRGSVLSSLYLTWFYIVKRIFGVKQPRSTIFERLDDEGYRKNGITDIFLIAVKK